MAQPRAETHTSSPRTSRLPAVLGPFSAATIVVGGMIGSGIFLMPRKVAVETGGELGLILALWAACGLVNLCGALSLAELSAMLPHDGGTYVFLREAYGRGCAFLWTWAEFWVIRTGAIAALAVGTTYALRDLGLMAGYEFSDSHWRTIEKLLAVSIIAMLAAINVVGTRWAGAVQNVTTVVKVGFILLLIALPMAAISRPPVESVSLWPATWNRGLWLGIAAAVPFIMWSYDGWGNLTVVAEEIRNPQRNVPLAMIFGVLGVMLLYLGANLALHWTLPVETIASLNIPALPLAEELFGGAGRAVLQAVLLISVAGALNQNILTGPRVLVAVARDFSVLAPLRRIERATRTPAAAIIAQSAWAMCLVGLADLSPEPDKRLFDVLTNYCIFGGSMFYLLAVVAVFVLRRRNPDAVRPYRTWGYPVTPALFVCFYGLFLAGMLRAAFWSSIAGLLLLAIGVVALRLVQYVDQAPPA